MFINTYRGGSRGWQQRTVLDPKSFFLVAQLSTGHIRKVVTDAECRQIEPGGCAKNERCRKRRWRQEHRNSCLDQQSTENISVKICH